MEYRAFEQRLLETIFTTDVQLTPATIAFLYKLSVQEAADLLQQAAVGGLLNIETDEEGNLLYVYPNRTRLQREAGFGGDKGERRNALVTVDVTAAPGPVRAPYPPSLFSPQDERPPTPQDALPEELGGAPTTHCPFCHEPILSGSKKCKHCHEYLDYVLRDLHGRGPAPSHVSVALQPQVSPQGMVQWTGTQAALLSLFMPGLGQMCSGRVPAGLLWMMFTIMGYFCLIIPGFVLHILCVINASRLPQPYPYRG